MSKNWEDLTKEEQCKMLRQIKLQNLLANMDAEYNSWCLGIDEDEYDRIFLENPTGVIVKLNLKEKK